MGRDRLRVLHITQYCHLGSVGGTERYIQDLIRELDQRGSANAIGWLTPGSRTGPGVYPLPGTPMRVDRPRPGLLAAMRGVADRFRPDLLHFHTFGRSEAALAAWAHQHGLSCAFTYHSPGWTCRREDLMAFGGSRPCDGEVRVLRCSACKLHERVGWLPVWLAWCGAVASGPVALLMAASRQTRLRRRLAFLADTWSFRRDLRRFLESCELIFSCAEWSLPLLVGNGAARGRIRLCPQGVSPDVGPGGDARPSPSADPRGLFTIGYVGRVVPVKGVDLLVAGFQKLASEDVRLRIHGWPEVVPDERFYRRLREAAEQDPRIELLPRVPPEEMSAVYSELDLLCIPSRWPETGPLVLFEALRRGVPVHGSRLVGQLDLLKSRGRLVDPNEAPRWHEALEQAVGEFFGGAWGRVRERALGSGPLRSMSDVAQEVHAAYQTCSPRILD